MRVLVSLLQVLVAAAAMIWTVAAPAAELSGRASVIDGDTIEIHGQRIRLHGIDAPESGQSCQARGEPWRCGQQAANALDRMLEGRAVSCSGRDVDRYGRIVAVCRVSGTDANAWMVDQGWALAYRRYSEDYVPLEIAAQRAQRGLWRGEFIEPWAWRRGERLLAANDNQAEGCKIKGNVSSEGERIYHVPGGQHYGRTKIDLAKGERWFCTEAEANAAGWRGSKR